MAARNASRSKLFFVRGINVLRLSTIGLGALLSRSALSARSVQAKKCFRASEQLFQAVSIRLRNDRRGSLFLHNPSSVVREHKRGNVLHQHIQFSCCLQSIYYRRGHIENHETGFTCWAFWTPSAPFTASKTSKSSASNTSRNMRLDRVIIDNHNEIATLHTPPHNLPFCESGEYGRGCTSEKPTGIEIGQPTLRRYHMSRTYTSKSSLGVHGPGRALQHMASVSTAREGWDERVLPDIVKTASLSFLSSCRNRH